MEKNQFNKSGTPVLIPAQKYAVPENEDSNQPSFMLLVVVVVILLLGLFAGGMYGLNWYRMQLENSMNMQISERFYDQKNSTSFSTFFS